jgi:hypothetical protein
MAQMACFTHLLGRRAIFWLCHFASGTNSNRSRSRIWRTFSSSLSKSARGLLLVKVAEHQKRLQPMAVEKAREIAPKTDSPFEAFAGALGTGIRGELEYLRPYVKMLRKKIEDDPARPQYILTLLGRLPPLFISSGSSSAAGPKEGDKP